jgi:hypothetical protein
MTQRHVELSNSEDTCVNKASQIVLEIDEHFSIIVKQYRHEVYVLIRSGTKCLKLPMDIYEAICNSLISVAYSKAILEGVSEGLCSYCGLQFVSEVECLRHEECEHRKDILFQQNYLESENCNQFLEKITDCL